MATAALVPFPRAVFYDANANPLAGGLVYTYVPGGTTPKTTWQDSGQATPNSNPIVLDANGSCLLYGSGNYQVTVTDSLGNAIPAYSGLSADTATEAGISSAMLPVVEAPTVAAALALMNGVLTFASIAALRSYAGTAVSACIVETYYASGIKGGGTFFYDSADTTTADNGGTVIVDGASRRWYRETANNSATLFDFGAYGNGSTDDTTAIQACITAAGSQGFRIVVPIGQFVVSSGLTSSLPVTIEGVNPGIGPGITDNANASILLCANTFTTGDMLALSGYYGSNIRNVQFAGALSLGYTSSCPRTSGAGIHITGPSNDVNFGSVVENCAFTGCYVGLQKTRGSQADIVRGNYFQAWGTFGYYCDNGATSIEASPGQVTENMFFGNPANAQTACLEAHDGYGTIRGNTFLGAQYGIVILADQYNIGNVTITENSIEEQYVQGIYITQNGSYIIDAVTIANNEFSNIANTGCTGHIVVQPEAGGAGTDMYNITISGNKFNSHIATNYAFIAVQDVNCQISNNVGCVIGGSCYGITVGSTATQISVYDNQLIANGGTLQGTTGYLIQNGAYTVLRDTCSRTFTAALLPAVGNGSEVYVTDGQATASNNLTVTGSGSGVTAWRMRGAWLTLPITG